MANIGVCLSGCGVNDGAEIHESVLTLLALHEAKADVVMMAPNIDQAHVIDHLAGAPIEGEQRNVLIESARIARGEIQDLAMVQLDELDALVLPGGFGVAKNLCNFAFKGTECEVNEQVSTLLLNARERQLPLGFACISPAMAAAIFREGKLTVGSASDPAAEAVNAFGATHISCGTSEIIIDQERRVVSTPAYMTGTQLPEIRTGLKLMVDQVLTWAAQDQLAELLQAVPKWSLNGGKLNREWRFDDFNSALAFVRQIGDLAEEHQHHPDLELGWGRVSVSLYTHDAGEITQKDVQLAHQIEQI